MLYCSPSKPVSTRRAENRGYMASKQQTIKLYWVTADDAESARRSTSGLLFCSTAFAAKVMATKTFCVPRPYPQHRGLTVLFSLSRIPLV